MNEQTGTAAEDLPSGAVTVRGATVEEALEKARADLGGADVRVLHASRLRRGGLGGFFAKELGVELLVAPAQSSETLEKMLAAARDPRPVPTREQLKQAATLMVAAESDIMFQAKDPVVVEDISDTIGAVAVARESWAARLDTSAPVEQPEVPRFDTKVLAAAEAEAPRMARVIRSPQQTAAFEPLVEPVAVPATAALASSLAKITVPSVLDDDEGAGVDQECEDHSPEHHDDASATTGLVEDDPQREPETAAELPVAGSVATEASVPATGTAIVFEQGIEQGIDQIAADGSHSTISSLAATDADIDQPSAEEPAAATTSQVSSATDADLTATRAVLSAPAELISDAPLESQPAPLALSGLSASLQSLTSSPVSPVLRLGGTATEPAAQVVNDVVSTASAPEMVVPAVELDAPEMVVPAVELDAPEMVVPAVELDAPEPEAAVPPAPRAAVSEERPVFNSFAETFDEPAMPVVTEEDSAAPTGALLGEPGEAPNESPTSGEELDHLGNVSTIPGTPEEEAKPAFVADWGAWAVSRALRIAAEERRAAALREAEHAVEEISLARTVEPAQPADEDSLLVTTEEPADITSSETSTAVERATLVPDEDSSEATLAVVEPTADQIEMWHTSRRARADRNEPAPAVVQRPAAQLLTSLGAAGVPAGALAAMSAGASLREALSATQFAPALPGRDEGTVAVVGPASLALAWAKGLAEANGQNADAIVVVSPVMSNVDGVTVLHSSEEAFNWRCANRGATRFVVISVPSLSAQRSYVQRVLEALKPSATRLVVKADDLTTAAAWLAMEPSAVLDVVGMSHSRRCGLVLGLGAPIATIDGIQADASTLAATILENCCR